ncbi:MAG: N-acetylmuramoyl-L-alanine amidase [Acaryochloris sp. RU_4_1]|nr:N-acetylmuramoyl-L-alanine amidase [Acaryochloris sp. RU_4_1]
MRHPLQNNRNLGRQIIRWFLPSLCGVFLSGLSAEAAQLQSWRFDQSQNRLEFSTDEDIRPRVQLIPNPTRLVVDLPGVTLGQQTLKQNLGNIFRTLRLGQVDTQTARIVLELDPAYTLDPQQIKVQGSSSTHWFINLPTPQQWQSPEPSSSPTFSSPTPASPNTPITLTPPNTSSSPTPSLPSPSSPPASSPTPLAQTQPRINDILVTTDGLFLPTQGNSSQIKIKRSRNKKKIQIKISEALLAPSLVREFNPSYHGIKSLSFKQTDQSPPVAELTLEVDKDSPDWQASVSRFGGIVLLPKGGPSANPSARRPGATTSLTTRSSPSNSVTPTSRLATIQRIDLGGRQLFIRADRPIFYATRWRGSTYQITINAARLTADLQGPKLGDSSPLSDIQVEETGNNTVTISAKPRDGVRIAGAQRLTNAVVLNLLKPGEQPIVESPVSSPSPSFPGNPDTPLPRVSNRQVVVIDPGHGGPDPGAIGIGGVRETDVVLDIGLEVSRILQRQGVVVYLTRTDERDVDLPPRVSLAERVNAALFVSIHANAISMSRPDINGLETYHAPGAYLGARLARTIHSTILSNLRIRDRGVRGARFYVIRKTSMPATLVETGFLTGQEDIVNLRNPAWRKQMAQAIAQGILNFLNGS